MTDQAMTYLTELVLEALENNGNEATTDVIYGYVEGNRTRLTNSGGSRHSIQGAVADLKQRGLIAAVAPATYRRVKNPQPIKDRERKVSAYPSPLESIYD